MVDRMDEVMVKRYKFLVKKNQFLGYKTVWQIEGENKILVKSEE